MSSGHLTALQKHVQFFNRRNKSSIYPQDTYHGCRALGFNMLISFQSALAFHLLHVSWPTQGWIPSLFLEVDISKISKAKHGSDTGTFNHEGEFEEDKYDRIFKKFDHQKKGGLYFSEIFEMWQANACVGDVIGWIFQVFLWGFLWLLAADRKTGVLDKESVRRQYDGSLYYELEKRQRSGDRLPFKRGGEMW